MAITQTISNFPTAPQSSDTPEDFNSKADVFIAHQASTYVPEVNTWASQANALENDLNGILDGGTDDIQVIANSASSSASSASSSAISAKQSAQDALGSATSSAGSANYKGEWKSEITYNMPSSVSHNGLYYNTIISGNTAHNPGTSPSQWIEQALDLIPPMAVGNINNPLFNLPLNASLDIKQGAGATTFTRSTTATYIDRYGVMKNTDIDKPRFEKDGILLEGASTNEVLNTADASQYGKMGTTYSTDGTFNPDGITTAGLFTGDGNSSEHYCHVSGTPASGNKSLSVFVKKGTASNVSIKVFATGGSGNINVGVNFNFDTEIINVGTAQKMANGWYRIKSDGLLSVTDQTLYSFRVYTDGSGISTSTDSVYVYGQQIEEIERVSSYIKTDNVAITRTSDSLTFDYYDNFPGWDKPFSVAFDYSKPTMGGGMNNFILNNGINANGYINQTGTGIIFFSVLGSSNFSSISTPLDKARIVCTSDGATTAIYQNGVLMDTGAVGSNTWNGTTIMSIGQDAFQNLRNFRIYDIALSANEARLA